MEVYSSIEELSAASDLVILGTVEGVAARECVSSAHLGQLMGN